MVRKVRLTLLGLNGNAFNLLGQFQRAAREQGWPADQIKAVIEEATSADYDHLLCTLIKHTEPTDSGL
jgi:hypothetical protein